MFHWENRSLPIGYTTTRSRRNESLLCVRYITLSGMHSRRRSLGLPDFSGYDRGSICWRCRESLSSTGTTVRLESHTRIGKRWSRTLRSSQHWAKTAQDMRSIRCGHARTWRSDGVQSTPSFSSPSSRSQSTTGVFIAYRRARVGQTQGDQRPYDAVPNA